MAQYALVLIRSLSKLCGCSPCKTTRRHLACVPSPPRRTADAARCAKQIHLTSFVGLCHVSNIELFLELEHRRYCWSSTPKAPNPWVATVDLQSEETCVRICHMYAIWSLDRSIECRFWSTHKGGFVWRFCESVSISTLKHVWSSSVKSLAEQA